MAARDITMDEWVEDKSSVPTKKTEIAMDGRVETELRKENELQSEARLAKNKSKVPKKDITVKQWEELQKWEKVDVPALALATATSFAKRRPVLVGAWAVGLLLAAFAGGIPVDDTAQEAYSIMFQQAEVIDSRHLGRSVEELASLEGNYSNLKGWFGACNEPCMKAFDKVVLARSEVARVKQHRDEVLSHARQEVGIWSSFGVQDVRKCFWEAWKSGKEFAMRCTMYDLIFMFRGKEETIYTILFKLVFQYLFNLTVGLVGAFFFFVYNVYCLIVSYGSSLLSGVAFLLLVIVAGVSILASYLGAVYGAVAGAGMMLMRHAAHQAAIQSGAGGEKHEKLLNAPHRPARCPV